MLILVKHCQSDQLRRALMYLLDTMSTSPNTVEDRRKAHDRGK